MILIIPRSSFAEYLAALSQHARKDYAYIKKHNSDLVYRSIDFDLPLVETFMSIWQMQLVRGRPIQWAFGAGHIKDLADQGKIKLFAAYKNGEPIAVHFIEKQLGFWDCHPPMYSKTIYAKRYMAKYMWFNLIKFAHDFKLDPLNMGGGADDWPEMIRTKHLYPNPQYKWLYIPLDTQQHPDSQPHYVITQESQTKCLTLLKN